MKGLNPSEKDFQQHIVECLTADKNFYIERKSSDFSLKDLCDREELLRFLRAQAENWGKVCHKFSNEQEALDAVIKRYKERLENESLIHILNGIDDKEFKIKGVKLKFVQYRPEQAQEDSEFVKLYRQNRFAVVQEFHFANTGDHEKDRIDLVFLINGIPFMTCELKNELSSTHWNYTDAIKQYKEDRDPKDDHNDFLKTCLVHFAVDNNYAFMTTRLAGQSTRFLPFNRETKNPPIDGEYSTAYLWQDIWQADSLLNIFEHFIKNYDETDEDGKKKNVTVFPRYHQLRAVRKLLTLCKTEGPGHNYLIEHSAGSGKTKSMAWLAHQLANAIKADGNNVFDSIIMVTDRIVLNANMADDVNNFNTVNGLVKDIRKGSKNLADAVDAGGRIIVCTVQKFAYALAKLKREKSRTYAVIIDEAHTAVGAESAKDLIQALSTDAEVKNALEKNEANCEDSVDAMLAYMQATRQQMPHISFFAFTATPKDKTYAQFGIGGKAHDLYSMRQAIDEKFILDVLQNYTTYSTLFEYVEKGQKENGDGKIQLTDENGEVVKIVDPNEYEKKKSVRLILKQLGREPKVMRDKADFIVAHFMENTFDKIDHKAKAMLVCESRAAVVEYKHLIDEIIKVKYNGKIKTLGAFSGSVEYNGTNVTEETLNGTGLKDNGIRVAFKQNEYRILIVADKFQTGFSEDLLHTMYVDKRLGDIQAIQTLSRLNRTCPGKDDTLVIDFRNDKDEIKKAFDRYHYGSSLDGNFDPEKLYSYRSELRGYHVYTQSQVDDVVKILLGKEPQKCISILTEIVNENVVNLDDATKDKFRKEVSRYMRGYGFLAQLMDFIDTDLEKEFLFLKALYGYLPYTKEVLPMEILSRIDLNKIKVDHETFTGKIEMGEGEALKPRYDKIKEKPLDEKARLNEILDIVNSTSRDYFAEHEDVIKPITLDVSTDSELHEAFRADNNYNDLIDLLKEKVMNKIGDESNDLLDFLSKIVDKSSPIGKDYINGLYNYLASITSDEKDVPFVFSVLCQRIADDIAPEFEQIRSFVRAPKDIAHALLETVAQPTMPLLDGANELIQDSLNMIYCKDNMRVVDRRRHFNCLISKYEVFLKKVYWLTAGPEKRNAPDTPINGAFMDIKKAFPFLWNLRNNRDSRYSNFQKYIEQVHDWRNDEAHLAPNADENEIKLATHILVTMYAFVISKVYDKLG